LLLAICKFRAIKEQTVAEKLIDSFGRNIDYVRISVTDRCDFRCTYCMAEKMTFLPRQQIMSLEEIEQIALAFTELGVRRIRLTGGEPLVRRGILDSIAKIGRLPNLSELTLTTNGSQLARYGEQLYRAGVSRLNISLDSLNTERFRRITRIGRLEQVLQGIDVANQQGFKQVKINTVVMAGINDDEVLNLLDFVRQRSMDISFIEEMPLGQIDDHERPLTYCSSDEVKSIIEQRYPLQQLWMKTAGPSRYFGMSDSNSRIGFISPHSHNFCASCNRVRVTVGGRLLLCLGHEHGVDLLPVLRRYPGDLEHLKQTIREAIPNKPERHYFDLSEPPTILRFMNATGG
jgi:cyclic pyranopterin phosphate synthase